MSAITCIMARKSHLERFTQLVLENIPAERLEDIIDCVSNWDCL